MKKNYLTLYKIVFGLLGFSALITEIVATGQRGTFNPTNFFSYFTVESNILAVIAFLLGALAIYSGKKIKGVDLFRGAATFYMVVTGIVFAVLLSGLDVELTAVPWDNIVLHYIIPVAIAIDWLLDHPVHQIAFKKALVWAVFPVAYLVYSLIRGASVGWYPYPFLNPTNGYGPVAVVSVAILIVALVLIFLMTRIGKPAKKKK